MREIWKPKKITLVCRYELTEFFKTISGVDEVIDLHKGQLSIHDYWAFMLSIPLHHQTTLATIPGHVPYLGIPPTAAQKWQGAFPKSEFKVGISWQGSLLHGKDKARSLSSLQILRPLWDVPGVRFYSLQKGRAEDQALSAPADMPLTNLADKIETFADTAAIVSQLDLVISVDTALVHACGALARPVWVLIPYLPDWRWLFDREDTPWYASMRLFRQPSQSDWATPIQRMKDELMRLVSRRT